MYAKSGSSNKVDCHVFVRFHMSMLYLSTSVAFGLIFFLLLLSFQMVTPMSLLFRLFSYIEDQLSEEQRKRCFFFNSFFYTRWVTAPPGQSYDHVKSWTKDVDIFEKDFLFIPVNERLVSTKDSSNHRLLISLKTSFLL